MRRILAAIAGMAMLLGITACQPNGGYSYSAYDRVCVNPYSHIYLDPYNCGMNPLWWYYVPAGTFLPAYGHVVVHYHTSYRSRPSGARIYTGKLSSRGGKAPKVTSGNKVSVVKPKSNNGGVNLNKNNGGYNRPKAPAPKVRVGGGGFGGKKR